MKRILAISLVAMLGGCSAPSTKLALEASKRVDDVRTFVLAQQHKALKVLLFRDTLAKLEAAGTPAGRQTVLNTAWNERDLLEFWLLQDQLARALHVATVDAKLASDQSIISLLDKSFARRAAAPVQAVDDWVAKHAGEWVGAAAGRPAGN